MIDNRSAVNRLCYELLKYVFVEFLHLAASQLQTKFSYKIKNLLSLYFFLFLPPPTFTVLQINHLTLKK